MMSRIFTMFHILAVEAMVVMTLDMEEAMTAVLLKTLLEAL